MVFKRFLLLTLVLALAATGAAQQDPISKIKQDLAGWREVMGMFIMDDGHYPEASSIEVLAQEVYTRQYWEQIVAIDPFGRPYRVSSTGNHFRIWTADNTASIENGFQLPVVKAEPMPATSAPSFSIPMPRSPDTLLYATKSGNDIKLDWTGAGVQYDGTIASSPRFSASRTLFLDSTASTYTYTNGLLKYDETFLCFDVTDEVEQNHAGYWNGGLLPSPPPTIDTGSPSTNIGSLYVGSAGTIVGTGFSTNPSENIICFDGGVCTRAGTATATLVQFTTPPGAVSGDLTVHVGSQSSDPATAFVTLEDPAVGWNIRTIGFSPLTGEYWMAGNYSTVNSIYRVYYNSGTKKWVKSDQRGGMAAQVLYCSGQTSRAGRLFCGYGATSTSGGTRYVDTNPAGVLTGCTGLPGSGANSINIRGAAVDPNPDAVAGRDVAYFAHADGGNNTYTIRRLSSTACYSPPPANDPLYDSNYGNTNWNGLWNPIVGLTVDPVNGDLYVATLTNVYKIDTSETVSAVKGGFTSIYGLDLFRQSAGDPGFLLIADAGASSTVKAIALDNTASAPLSVVAAPNMRAATWGGAVFSGDWAYGNVNRSMFINNNGNSGAVSPIRANPFIGVTPAHPVNALISAPPPCNGAGGPTGQPFVAESNPSVGNASTAKVQMWYKDGKSRYTCAFSGDPLTWAAYEAPPADPLLCGKPREATSGLCDNKDDFSATWNGVGAFTDTSLLYSCKTCGGTGDTCEWSFWITKRYSGDNYAVLFSSMNPPSTNLLYSASFPYIATKHIHLEPDKMCGNGGILKLDAAIGVSTIYLAMNPDASRADTVNQGDTIHIFDAATPYEGNHDVACVKFLQEEPGQLRVRLDLADEAICTTDCTVTHAVYTDQDVTGQSPWDFSSGNSAGVCVNDALFYQTDQSNLPQPFGDAFVTYHSTANGTEGAGVIPYMPAIKLATLPDKAASAKHHQIWYANKKPFDCFLDPPANTQPCPQCCNERHNHNHVIGTRICDLGDVGDSIAALDVSWVFVSAIGTDCIGCTGSQLPNYIRYVTCHECGHQFNVNCPLGYHDTNDAWCGLCSTGITQKCILNLFSILQDRTDGVDKFCSDNLFHDPMSCGADLPQDSIRTTIDPL